MFSMKVKKQLTLNDRPLILGMPTCSAVPRILMIDQMAYKVIGISAGTRAPYLAIELVRTTNDLIGKKATA